MEASRKTNSVTHCPGWLRVGPSLHEEPPLHIPSTIKVGLFFQFATFIFFFGGEDKGPVGHLNWKCSSGRLAVITLG